MSNAIAAYRLISQSYKKAPKKLTICFLVIFAVASCLATCLAREEFDHHVYIRDHGISVYGRVTKKYTDYGRTGTDYFIDYAFRPAGESAASPTISSEYHQVGSNIYSTHNVGSQILTRYDPKNPEDTHLYVQNWSDSKLALNSALSFLMLEIGWGTIIFFAWWFATFIYDIFFGPVGVPVPPNSDSRTAS